MVAFIMNSFLKKPVTLLIDKILVSKGKPFFFIHPTGGYKGKCNILVLPLITKFNKIHVPFEL